MEEKISWRSAVSMNLRAMKLLHQINPHFLPVLSLSCITSALIPYVTVFFSARILSGLTLHQAPEVLWKWILGSLLGIGLLNLLNCFLKQRNETLTQDLFSRKEILFAKKMFSMDYADLDRQETHDLLAQIQQNENWSSWGLRRVPEVYEYALKSLTGLLSGVALMVSLFSTPVPETAGKLVILNHPVFILLLALVMVLISVLAARLNTRNITYWSSYSESATLGNRCSRYYFGFLGYNKSRNMDVRVYQQQQLVDANWKIGSGVFDMSSKIAKATRGTIGLCTAFGDSVSMWIVGFVYIFTCMKAWAGAFDIGSITQYVGAATAMIDSVFILTGVFGVMKTNATYLKDVFRFLDIPNAMYQGSLTTEKRSDRQYEVEFQDVSFKYPGSERWSLRHVSMKFKIGSRLAIVGENGSGKTTFIKLLCRLYDPQEGRILLNGIDIRKYRYDDYMKIFSIVFQDFQLIAQPLGANVAGSNHYDRERARKALIDAGFGDRLASMPHGLDTELYRDMNQDGVEVSGGEAQKIAIARALYKNAPFIVLDEPTAALDPIAEAEIYSKFNEIVGDKTAIYISHRLSSCKFCDEIAVFHEGAIVQQGTHESLVADESGKYHELWHAQAQYYTD